MVYTFLICLGKGTGARAGDSRSTRVPTVGITGIPTTRGPPNISGTTYFSIEKNPLLLMSSSDRFRNTFIFVLVACFSSRVVRKTSCCRRVFGRGYHNNFIVWAIVPRLIILWRGGE